MVRRGSQRVSRTLIVSPTPTPPPPSSSGWTHVVFGSADVSALHYNGTTWVAGTYGAGGNAKLWYATDPTVVYDPLTPSTSGGWELSHTIAGASISSIHYGGGYWVASSSGGTPVVFYTNDLAKTWIPIILINLTTGATGIKSVYYNAGTWVFVSDTTDVICTTDITAAITNTSVWKKQQLASSLSNPYPVLARVMFGDRWLIGDTNGSIWYTSNPISGWLEVNVSANPIYGLEYHSGTWVVSDGAGNVWSSTDPTASGNWSSVALSGATPSSIKYGSGWMTSDASRVWTTSDPTKTWTSETVASGANITSVTYGSGKWVVGDLASYGIWYK